MPPVELEPATDAMARLIRGIRDDQLDGATPCPDYTLGDLVDDVGGFALAFTAAAAKTTDDASAQAPSGDASRLGDDWRERIVHDLGTLATAWRDPDAWTGMTRAGGIELPGEVAGVVALDELVIHGWDVARASGQPFECEPALLEVVHGFVSQFAAGDSGADSLFGPPVDVPGDAPLLDRVVGLTGRDPTWSPRG